MFVNAENIRLSGRVVPPLAAGRSPTEEILENIRLDTVYFTLPPLHLKASVLIQINYLSLTLKVIKSNSAIPKSYITSR